MPTLLLVGIPVAVVILFIGIMSLPDEEMKEEKAEVVHHKPAAAKAKSKKKRK